MKLSGWGNFPVHDVAMQTPRVVDEVVSSVHAQDMIARGNGRAYGDSALNTHATVNMCGLNRFIAFDADTGVLTAEAGVILGDVIAAMLPRGWFPWVTPGTKFVTLGGMVAADVHGKNHHGFGSFRHCVEWFDLCDAKGDVRRCSRTQNADLFDWTFGAMGLTGVILRVALRLRPVETGWIRQRTIAASDLGAVMALFETHAAATYSVAWIDCLATGKDLGRSLLMLGEHASAYETPARLRAKTATMRQKRRLRVPALLPGGLLNRLTVRAFNAAYYRWGAHNAGSRIVDWDSYFYPLDAILGWNRIYGRKGFTQFQCVLPETSAHDGLEKILKQTALAGMGSFLAVLKRLGPQDGPFSFPMEGFTLALDFPVSPATTRLIKKLEAITLEHHGRFYLAKDSHMSAETLRASDDRIADFTAMRDQLASTAVFRSEQSKRLKI
ncbi:FAD-binding oxidoreductase [Yoonia sp. F2084L]|uniref:FAD-binding oxidoreductase n=1 Tax=Yoonia sp. F2084L TaxID=2926419 RepID=UPI001FF33CD5|nr:FAD-binding oxidoreductase [Yoonia sp. F2084L]MCK0097121.1 FAD-binding oxidoreductase [Yoonia sp. F2084L]